MKNICTNELIVKLCIDSEITKKLEDMNIYTVNELWKLKRIDLKRIGLSDSQINQVIIKLQLRGIDLNKKVYNQNR